jgi:hypothetical protein
MEFVARMTREKIARCEKTFGEVDHAAIVSTPPAKNGRTDELPSTDVVVSTKLRYHVSIL